MAKIKGDLDLTIYEANPLLYWAKIQDCYKNDYPIPSEVMDYLNRVAGALLKMKSPGKEAAEMIQDALELNPATYFEDMHKRAERDGLGPYLFKHRIYLRVLNKKYAFDEGKPIETIFHNDNLDEIRYKIQKGQKIGLDYYFKAVAYEFFGDDPDDKHTSTVRTYYYLAKKADKK